MAVEPGSKPPPAKARAKVKAKPRAAAKPAQPVELSLFIGDGVEIKITASDLKVVTASVSAALGAEGALEFFDPEFEEWVNFKQLKGEQRQPEGFTCAV